ncbi:MAG TPA: nucleotidyl transferase AbiEii/AbiGii toxin family protein [Kofleriaceae bacterium]|nr:nucleotidyl transferase AbiEii/AbiGii toxin family protein [Kofleriaceae bacterium]
MTISELERRTLERLVAHWPEQQIVVIGAAALRWQLGMEWRVTLDIDLTVALEVQDLASLRELPGWRRDPRHEQRWITDHGQRVDVVPAAARHLRDGMVTWPETGAMMDVSVLDLAFSCALKLPGLEGVAVASLPAIALLKMAAFLDRRYEREHDLGDIAHILDRFVGDDDDRRWYDPAIDPDLAFDLVSPFAVGLALGAVAGERHHALARRFVNTVGDDASAVHARLRALAPVGWSGGSSIEERLKAFLAGLSGGGGGGRSPGR